MKWILISVVILLASCQLENRRPVNLDPVIEAAAPIAVELFVPELYKTLALVLLAAVGGGVGVNAVGKKKKNAGIKNAVKILCLLCAASRDMVIDALTGILWDEEEAGGIKSYGK